MFPGQGTSVDTGTPVFSPRPGMIDMRQPRLAVSK
jgi:hypothetical protein